MNVSQKEMNIDFCQQQCGGFSVRSLRHRSYLESIVVTLIAKLVMERRAGIYHMSIRKRNVEGAANALAGPNRPLFTGNLCAEIIFVCIDCIDA